MKNIHQRIATFGAALAIGLGGAFALASAAAVSAAAPALRAAPKAVDVVRLDPVVVTISRETFARIRAEETQLARSADAKKVTRG